MRTDISKAIETLKRHINLNRDEISDLSKNYHLYESGIEKLLQQISKYSSLKEELSSISSEIARLNYETYETYMAIHTNSIAISGHRAAIRISGQRLSKDLESDLEDLLAKYLMMKF